MSVPKVTAPPEKAQAATRPGVAMAVITTGVLMMAAGTTIVVLALPEIQRGLHVALSAVVWVIISFLLVITLLATQVGRLGDMFGRVRMYEMGFAVFVLAIYAQLHGRIADAFTSGLHAAFYASMGFMVLAAGLSALRVRSPHA